MTKSKFDFTLALSAAVLSGMTQIAISPHAFAGEPAVPPPVNQPHMHIVEIKENAVIRMGDTVNLKGTDFSAKLTGFREPLCAGPRAGCKDQAPIPEFEITEGATTCTPDPKSRACHRKLSYTVTADTVKDRTAVTVRIKRRRIKTTH